MSLNRPQHARTTKPLRIVFGSSEALPYFKSGGLADVARALPDALARRGHEVRILHPHYSSLHKRLHLEPEKPISVPWAGGALAVQAHVHHPRARATAVLFDHAAFHVGRSPYEDFDAAATGRRFALFSRAILHYAQRWQADIIHLNDWQTGLVPAYALVDAVRIPTLFAIHNLAYQGIFDPSILEQIDLPRELHRTENGLEFYGNVSFLKGGLALADRLVTVSPTYAREIQTSEYGAGLEGLLRFRARDLFGILNGIDLELWDPATDEALNRTYDVHNLHVKDELRLQLLGDAGMDEDRPLLVVVSRLAHQKGIDIVLAAMPELLESGASLFVLGDGDAALEAQFAELAQALPRRVTVTTRFDDALARRLYASGDFFLMPSRYEPCGLGQMIAQRYGTPPIVRATGGLRDTVTDGQTGFCFDDATVPDFIAAIRRALLVWRTSQWNALRRRCMALDWSWLASAERYEEVYRNAIGPGAD